VVWLVYKPSSGGLTVETINYYSRRPRNCSLSEYCMELEFSTDFISTRKFFCCFVFLFPVLCEGVFFCGPDLTFFVAAVSYV
jgi:hypothetical protein